jgi:hypothetical protein
MDILPELLSGHFSVLVAPRSAMPLVLDLAAHMACRAPLRVLDGGNSFNVYRLAQTVRGRAPDLRAVLSRIWVARAFTCVQMAALLSEIPNDAAIPTLVLDPLATFYDESLPEEERRRLLLQGVGALARRSQSAPVGVFAIQRPDNVHWLDRLVEHADPVWRLEVPPPVTASPQLRLF